MDLAESHEDDVPLVSIVTICKNAAPFIENCVQSVLNQGYPRLEHIVQDGGSTDGTMDVLRKYGHLSVVSKPDRGMSEALNRAFLRVRGDILGFLCADERLCPGAVRWAVDAFQRYPEAGLVYGDCRLVDERYHEIAVWRPPALTFEEFFCGEVIPAQGLFIRTRCFREVGFQVDPRMTCCPDFDMWVRLGLRYRFQYEPGVVAENMIHAGSQTCDPARYPSLVAAKRHVILRTTQSPGVPARIRSMRSAALAGLYEWAGLSLWVAARQEPHRSFRWLLLALMTDPRRSRCTRLLRIAATTLFPRGTPRVLKRPLKALTSLVGLGKL